MKFEMKKTVRLYSKLNDKPPKGARVLLDGKNLDEWKMYIKKKKPKKKKKKSSSKKEPAKVNMDKWSLIEGNAMEIKTGTGWLLSKREFSSFKLHMEFRTPFKPTAFGQKRGNSGVYLLGLYEVQILDSYGLEGMGNECGGIYKVSRPQKNMCAPPLQWQTYDITYHPAEIDKDGNKKKNVRITVVHNGVTIHDDLDIPGPTGGASSKEEKQSGGIMIQNHGNPVQFRNIWVVELDK